MCEGDYLSSQVVLLLHVCMSTRVFTVDIPQVLLSQLLFACVYDWKKY